MSFSIRRAVPKDTIALRALNRAFNDEEADTKWIEKHLGRRRTTEHVFVAVEDRTLIGFCCICITSSFCRSTPKAEVTEIYVAAEHRRKRVAQRMIAAAVQLADKLEVSEFFVLTNKQNSAGRCLYESLGFVEGNDMLYRRKKRPTSQPRQAEAVHRNVPRL